MKKLVLLLLLLCLIPTEAWGWNIQVSWNPNLDPVGGYIVSWGTESGKYDRQADTKQLVTWTVVPHTQNSKIFIVVQAYNAAGWSPPSNEVLVLPPVGPLPTPTPGATASPVPTVGIVKPLTPTGVKIAIIP